MSTEYKLLAVDDAFRRLYGSLCSRCDFNPYDFQMSENEGQTQLICSYCVASIFRKDELVPISLSRFDATVWIRRHLNNYEGMPVQLCVGGWETNEQDPIFSLNTDVRPWIAIKPKRDLIDNEVTLEFPEHWQTFILEYKKDANAYRRAN